MYIIDDDDDMHNDRMLLLKKTKFNSFSMEEIHCEEEEI
jgi:hypothetical protein